MNVHPTRRIAALTAATMLLSFATIVPAASAPARLSATADPQWPSTMPYVAYGGAPDWYSVATPSTAAPDTATATADEEAGLVLVSTTLAGDSGTAAGTGMVIDEDGIVLTNHHVVEGSDSIKVTVATTDTTYTARVLGTDAVHDVAVLQLVGADNLTTVTPDSSVAVGDEVTAVGDANGDGGSLTASEGSVTALARSITVQGEDGTPSELDGLIEVDADVIAGDSGGALLDADGQVVGMTTAASSGSADVTGYAVPINTALTIADQILAGHETGSVELGYDGFLGVQLGTSTTIAGVVDGSPALAAGLVAGDTITAVDGTRITTADQLHTAISSHDAGDKITVTWSDSTGGSRTASITLAEAPVS